MNEHQEGCFFAIDHRCWARVCDIGVNAATAYLVLARGTGRDQGQTAWSVSAIENYTGISRSRARIAIQALQQAGLISQIRTGNHPLYKMTTWAQVAKREANLDGVPLSKLLHRGGKALQKLLRSGVLEQGEDGVLRPPKAEWIFLPNEIVTGAAEETPPLELLRQCQDTMTLRLFVDFYRSQNLREDGGINRKCTYWKYVRCKVGQRGPFTVWGFSRGNRIVRWSDATLPHRRDENDLTDEEIEAGENQGVDFFARTNLLADLGLIEWIPYLFESDGDDAEIIHPLWTENTTRKSIENRIGFAAHEAALSLLSEKQKSWVYSEAFIVVPVPRHWAKVQVIGIARLRYRPKTSMTAAWWADLQTKGDEYVRGYEEIADPSRRAPASKRLAISR